MDVIEQIVPFAGTIVLGYFGDWQIINRNDLDTIAIMFSHGTAINSKVNNLVDTHF